MRIRLSQILLLLPLLLIASWQVVAAEDDALEPSSINTRYILMNHFAEVITDQEFRDKYQLISFGYTHCPDVCPNTLSVVSAALKELGEAGEVIQPLFITVDPERDTPSVLRDYVQYFHPRIIGLTGTHAVINRTASNFKVRFEKVVNEGDDPKNYWMDHTASLYLVGQDGTFITKFAYGISAQTLVEKLKPYL